MQKITLILYLLLATSLTAAYSQNAPVTMAPTLQLCPGVSFEIPITVSDFSDIGALSLTMNYNSSVLIYESFTNNSGFPGLIINGSIPGTIIAGGFINPIDPGISLADNSVLFTLTFFFNGGTTNLEWFDDGITCEYADADFAPLYDSPTSTYYINGLVQSYSPVNAPITTVPNVETCPYTYIDIPVSVSDFCNIGAVSLTLNYNSSILNFDSFTNNSGFPGLIINGSIPGSIYAGGYIAPNDPGISLADNTVLFTLTFYSLGGYTDLEWYDNGESCEYTDALFVPLNDAPTSLYYFNGSVSSSSPLNAPITSVPNLTTCSNTYIDIPVTVSDFCNIGALSLTLNYNSSVLTYDSFNNNSGFPGLVINGSIPGSVYAGGYIAPNDPGISLADNSILFTLTFYCMGGDTDLEWFDNGESCEYTDALFVPLNDSPTSSYYLNGSVSSSSPDNAPLTTAPKIKACANNYIDIPVTVSDFCNIGALSLTLNYNSSVLIYDSYINNSGFPGLVINGSIPGSTYAGGYIVPNDPGVSLVDNSVLFTLTFVYNEGYTDLEWFDNGESCEYTDELFNPLIDSPTSAYYLNGSVTGCLELELKVFLEGPFGTTDMSTDLNPSYIPVSQPYNTSPWNYAGAENINTLPNDDVVDWILVELRKTIGNASTATADKMFATRSGLLMKDGSIKELDGIKNLGFPELPTENLYIIIYHRNHVMVMSASPSPINNGFGSYDFSSGESQVYGGSTGHKELLPGLWGLASGDSNADGTINESDKQNFWNQNAGKQGYLPFDFSMDSQVNNKDKNDFWYLNLGFINQVP